MKGRPNDENQTGAGSTAPLAAFPRVPEERVTLIFLGDERAELGDALEVSISEVKRSIELCTSAHESALKDFADSRERLDKRTSELHDAEKRLRRLQSVQSMIGMMTEYEDAQ